MEISVQQLQCPYCKGTISPTDKFCSSCGKAVNETGIGIGKQIYIYLVSIFLAPLGFIWFFKYFRSTTENNKRIGWIAGILTTISFVLAIWLTVQFLQSVQSQVNQYTQLGI